MKGGSVGMYKETFLEIDFSTRHITLYQRFAGKRIINKLLIQLDISFFVLYAIYKQAKASLDSSRRAGRMERQRHLSRFLMPFFKMTHYQIF